MSTFTPIRPLQASDHVNGFSSGKPELDNWLASRAIRAEQARTTRTYVVLEDGTQNVVGYYSLAAGSVAHELVGGGWLMRNTPDPVPVILLGRLAVERSFHGRGLGAALLKDAIRKAVAAANVVGSRALLVHALDDDAKGFYLRYQFRELPSSGATLYLPLKSLSG
ncbi:MAG: GNAT family N-acetyltransferase [Promicromonosporaceae bacterium]|nr:GNAT family N-acetyltransferase [Promicromonosporaceae bacterium]